MIRIEIKDDSKDLLKIADAIEREIEDTMVAIGTELLGYVAEDFEAKSEGKAGAGGIVWDPLDAKTIAKKNKRNRRGAAPSKTMIGIDTGIMRNSINQGFRASDGKGGNILEAKGNEVTVGVGRTYAHYFDKKRTIIPEELPREWEEAAEEIVQDWIEDLWNKRMK